MDLSSAAQGLAAGFHAYHQEKRDKQKAAYGLITDLLQKNLGYTPQQLAQLASATNPDAHIDVSKFSNLPAPDDTKSKIANVNAARNLLQALVTGGAHPGQSYQFVQSIFPGVLPDTDLSQFDNLDVPKATMPERVAGINADSRNYGAELRSEDSRYRADTGLEGRKYSADAGYAGRVYSADQGLAGRQYTADKGLEGRKYGADSVLEGKKLDIGFRKNEGVQNRQNKKDVAGILARAGITRSNIAATTSKENNIRTNKQSNTNNIRTTETSAANNIRTTDVAATKGSGGGLTPAQQLTIPLEKFLSPQHQADLKRYATGDEVAKATLKNIYASPEDKAAAQKVLDNNQRYRTNLMEIAGKKRDQAIAASKQKVGSTVPFNPAGAASPATSRLPEMNGQPDSSVTTATGRGSFSGSPRVLFGSVHTAIRNPNVITPGGHVISVWGDSRDGGSRRHEGNDIQAPEGSPIHPVTDGVVKRIDAEGHRGKYGNVVEISHGGGWSTIYAHLERLPDLKPGQRVSSSDVIGNVGTTGNARGGVPHVHFEVVQNGRRFDPQSFQGESSNRTQLASRGKTAQRQRTGKGPSKPATRKTRNSIEELLRKP